LAIVAWGSAGSLRPEGSSASSGKQGQARERSSGKSAAKGGCEVLYEGHLIRGNRQSPGQF
jgi:hypothetical protein